MNRPANIDFFELSDKILNRLNCDGKFKLTHYDFDLRLRRDTNYPSDKFNIYLLLFGQEISVTYYTLDYNHVDKIVNILFVHLEDDGGFDSVEDAVILYKIASIEERLTETMEAARSLVEVSTGDTGAIISIDEKYPYDVVDEKGFPFFQLIIYSKKNDMNLKVDISSMASDFSDKENILKQIRSKLGLQ